MLCDLHYSGLTVDLDRQSLLYVRDAAGLKLAVYNRSRKTSTILPYSSIITYIHSSRLRELPFLRKNAAVELPEIRMPSAERRQHGNHAGCNITRLRQQNANAYFLACCASRFFLLRSCALAPAETSVISCVIAA